MTGFVAAADRICERLQAQQLQVEARFGGRATASLWRAMAALSLEADQAVNALPLPAEGRERISALRASYFREVPAIEAIASALEADDLGSAKMASRRFSRLATANALAARSLGIVLCAKALPSAKARRTA